MALIAIDNALDLAILATVMTKTNESIHLDTE
jgi:hypothetical protein